MKKKIDITDITAILIGACSIVILLLVLPARVYIEKKYYRTEANITKIEVACENYNHDHGMFPPEKNWYEELTGASNAVINTNFYTYIKQRSIRDGWHNIFVYNYPGKINTNSIDLYSTGGDGISVSGGNDPDDINNWDPERRWRKHYNSPRLIPAIVLVVIVIILVIAGGVNMKIK